MMFPGSIAWSWPAALPPTPEAWRDAVLGRAWVLRARFDDSGLMASIVFDKDWVRYYANEIAQASGGKAWSPLAQAEAPCAAMLLHDEQRRVYAAIGARLLWIEGGLAEAMRRWPEAPTVGPELAADIADRHVVWMGALWRDPAMQGRGLGGALTEAMALDALLRWRFGHIVGLRRDRGLLALDMAPFRRVEAPVATQDGADYALVAAARAQLRALAGVTA